MHSFANNDQVNTGSTCDGPCVRKCPCGSRKPINFLSDAKFLPHEPSAQKRYGEISVSSANDVNFSMTVQYGLTCLWVTVISMARAFWVGFISLAIFLYLRYICSSEFVLLCGLDRWVKPWRRHTSTLFLCISFTYEYILFLGWRPGLIVWIAFEVLWPCTCLCQSLVWSKF